MPASAPTAAPATRWGRAEHWFQANVGPFLTPYYLSVVALIGAVTAFFTVLLVIIVLVSTNFNLLGWIE